MNRQMKRMQERAERQQKRAGVDRQAAPAATTRRAQTQEKRKRIGTEFIRVFEESAKEIGPVAFLAQGTLYPDVIESSAPERKAAVRIKTHHNVGGLPADMQFRLIEPLRQWAGPNLESVTLSGSIPKGTVYSWPYRRSGANFFLERSSIFSCSAISHFTSSPAEPQHGS